MCVALSFAQEKDKRQNIGITSEPYKSWTVGASVRSDGFGLSVDIARGKKQHRYAWLYQASLGYYRSLSQVKQESLYTSSSGTENFKPFFFGKQNNLFGLHLAVGQKILLAERARKNGVKINYQYAAGFTVGILKPYLLRICTDLQGNTCYDEDYLSYEQAGDSLFLDNFRIISAGGFGKGWNLKAQLGLHFNTGVSFDWSSRNGFIKEVLVGFSCDIYFKETPIMLRQNKAIFPSALLGFSIGRRKVLK